MLPAGHPLADLAGVGVAYKLAEALLQSQDRDPGPLLDLVAMGLVADLAMLKAETRLLTQRGILGLRKTERLISRKSQSTSRTLRRNMSLTVQ